MGSFSMMHWVIVLVVVLLVFGAGKLPNVMGDLAKGVRSFKREMAGDGEGEAPRLAKDGGP